MTSEQGEAMSESIAVPAAGAAEATPTGPVVEAHELTRRYGEGDTAVDALRGVSLEVARGKLTAVMGPSGSGKVDADAHPRRTRHTDERLRGPGRNTARRP
jgi:ABC-type glutathione transport system ATPase component